MKDEPNILLSDDFRCSVEENLGRDPVRVALDRRIPHAALVASQVKYLRRARNKLPSYYAARCIVPPLAFEQSSSEVVAAGKEYSGRVAIDLTCGLGVDSWALSKRFGRVIAIERDGELAAIARENFRRLGANNIEVVMCSAEQFLSNADTRAGLFSAAGMPTDLDCQADLVYADPDRRSAEGKKMVRMEDCSPDIVALLPALRRITPRLVVKLSPLFDVDEVFRVFGTAGTRAEVVSYSGECKEIIADVEFGSQSRPVVRAVAIGLGEAEYPFDEKWRAPEEPFAPEQYRYLVVPDVALQKGRLARRYLSGLGVWTGSDNGYGFATSQPGDIIGKVIETESIEPFDPKALKRRLKAAGVRSIDILRRDFPLSAAEIARASGIREGGSTQIAFTRAAGRLWQIALKV